MTNDHFSTLGLILDIIGVIIVYFYGMPPHYNNGYVEAMPEDEYKSKERLSKAGFIIIILGFVFQLIPYLRPYQ